MARGERAFTLFTALVSILLIVLTVLLAQTMIRTERTVTDSVADVQEQQEMQAIADLARADAMQVFNFGVRYQIEQYLTSPTNYITIEPRDVTWNEIVRAFAIANFGGSDNGIQFATRTANHLSNILGAGKGQDFKTFRLDLESNIEQMRVVLQKLFQESVKQEDFFEVIDCPTGEYTHCVGTFYVNLNMARISDTDYEKLPQIRVLNRDTGRVIKEPILPRSNFRIYVPLRIFKALAGAKALAHTPNTVDAEDSEYIRDEADHGLLSARVHNEIEELKLGLCDPKSCRARTNPYFPEAHVDNGLCPGDPNAGAINLIPLDLSALGGMGITASGSYNARDAGSMGSQLAEIIKQRLYFVADSVAAEYNIGPDNGLEIVMPGSSVLSNLKVNAEDTVSKRIVQTGGTASSTTTVAPASFGSTSLPNSPLSGGSCPTMVEGTGAYFERDEAGNWESKTEFVPVESCLMGEPTTALCEEVKEFEAYLVFRETDEKYKVSKNNENQYTIRIYDAGFTPFTHRYEPMGQACALPGKPVERSCQDVPLDADWTCYSIKGTPTAPGGTAGGPDHCYTQ